MSKIPSVLMLDDGELDRVRRLLDRLGADYAHVQGDEVVDELDAPTDLLITTGKRALDMPHFNPLSLLEGRPTWICIHGHDVAELRDQLREMGVNYLVHSAIDQNSLRLLVEQVLYDRADRRRAARLPLGIEVTYRVGNELDKGKLAELSMNGCRVLTAEQLHPDTEIWIYLPRELTEDRKVGYEGRIVRSAPYEPQPGVQWYSSVVRFEGLDEDAVEHLEGIFSGERPGTRVTPLEASPRDDVDLVDVDRRRSTRHVYERRMALLGAVGIEAPQVMVGRDLSIDGLRIASDPNLRPGMQIALALYGDVREEPIVVNAEVLTDYGEKGLGLRFATTTEAQRKRIQALLDELPVLEEVCNGGDSRVIMSQVLDPPPESVG